MLNYWILKRPDGRAAGLVRVQDDRVLLTLSAPNGTYRLFSDAACVPIVPERELRFVGAKAVLGTDGSFAVAPDAESIAVYRARLSQICTKEEAPSPVPVPTDERSRKSTIEAEEPAQEMEREDDISQYHTSKPDSIADTARNTADFSLLLARADAFYAAYEDPGVPDEVVQKEDMEADGGIDLFRQEFPGVRWRYVDGTDVLPHYEGTWRQPNGGTMHILAVRGYAAPRPPRALCGFTRFLRDENGVGYWLRLTPLP